MRQLYVKWDVESLINMPTTMLVGIVLVIIAFNVAQPISHAVADHQPRHAGYRAGGGHARLPDDDHPHARRFTQVVGFLSMENGLFLAATSATYGMPMVVELGIALDVLVGVIILGVFFFQIREQFDSLDIRHMEKLKDG